MKTLDNRIILTNQKTFMLNNGTYLNKNINVFTIKRFMMRNAVNTGCRHVTCLPPKISFIPNRTYANKFSIHHWTNLTDDEKKLLGLQQHEISHANVVNNSTNTVESILTSSKGANAPQGIEVHKISDVKFNGSYIPLKDKKTKLPILDENGKEIPNPNKGGQFLATLKTPRKISKDVQHKFQKDSFVQEYMDQHESKIKDILDKKSSKIPSRKIGGQDDE